jgi:hypothetical protein
VVDPTIRHPAPDPPEITRQRPVQFLAHLAVRVGLARAFLARERSILITQ